MESFCRNFCRTYKRYYLCNLDVVFDSIREAAFRGIKSEECSIIIPTSVYTISSDSLVYTNINMYCLATDYFYGNYRDIEGTYHDEELNEDIHYKCTRYYYSETEKQDIGIMMIMVKLFYGRR